MSGTGVINCGILMTFWLFVKFWVGDTDRIELETLIPGQAGFVSLPWDLDIKNFEQHGSKLDDFLPKPKFSWNCLTWKTNWNQIFNV